ncbi:hypothetical protein DMUE_2102, partial [Dictyocoela muelleri]
LKFYEIKETLNLIETKEFTGIQHISLTDKFYFSRHNELYCEMQLFRKFESEILCINDGAIGCDDGLVVYGSVEFEHSCGVVGIALADNIFILDVRGRLVIYKDKIAIGSFDNLNLPMIYDQYLFVCDRNFLFCKTREAFAMFVELKDDITDFCLYMNLLSIRSGRKILVIDINSKEVVTEYKFKSDSCGKFFIDEFFNRLIVFDGHEYKSIDLPEIKPRGKIIFEEDRIFQKKVYEEKVDCNLEIEEKESVFINGRLNVGFGDYKKNKANNVFKNLQARDSVNELFERNQNPELKALFEEKENYENHEKRKITDFAERNKFGNSGFFDEVTEFKNGNFPKPNKYENKYDYEDEYKIKTDKGELKDIFNVNFPQSKQPFMPAMVKTKDITLLSYNKDGYLIMKIQDEYNFVEAIYHDKSKVGRKVQDYSKPKIGTIGVKGFVLSNRKVANFYGRNDWDVNVENRGEIILLGIGDVIVLVVGVHVEIYSAMGKIQSRILVPGNPISVIVENSDIHLFLEDKVLSMSPKYKQYCLENTSYIGNDYNFCGVNNKEIFYGSKSIYKISNGLSKEICTIKGTPLCVFNDYVISLDGEILPEPVVEYHKITEYVVSDDEIEESVESFEEMPTHFREENVLKTKKFDPRNF